MSFATTDAGRRSDITASTVSRLVNEAYMEVAATSNPEGLERIAVSSTTTGENRIDLPTEFIEPISATLIWPSNWTLSESQHSSFQTLRLVSVRRMDSHSPYPSGIPQEIAFYDSWLELWPSPNSAYSLQFRYRSGVTDMLQVDEVPSVTTPWRQAIKLKTEEKIHKHVQDSTEESKSNIRYLQYVSGLKSDQAKRQSGQFPQGMDISYYGSKGNKSRSRRRGSSGRWTDTK